MSVLTEQVGDIPVFEYGRWRTRRDRDAKTIREVVRNAGRPSSVTQATASPPTAVATRTVPGRLRLALLRRTLCPAAEIAAYTAVGMRVETPASPDVSLLLLHVTHAERMRVRPNRIPEH